MTDLFPWLRELFPSPLKPAIAVVMVGALVLFGPTEALGLKDFVSANRGYLLIGWLVIVVYVAVEAIWGIYRRVGDHRK